MVSVLTINTVVLLLMVIPLLARHEGTRMVDLPVRLLLPMATCAGVSFAFWMLDLVLGSNQILRTAGWDVLSSVEIFGATFCIAGVVSGMFLLWAIMHRRVRAPSS